MHRPRIQLPREQRHLLLKLLLMRQQHDNIRVLRCAHEGGDRLASDQDIFVVCFGDEPRAGVALAVVATVGCEEDVDVVEGNVGGFGLGDAREGCEMPGEVSRGIDDEQRLVPEEVECFSQCWERTQRSIIPGEVKIPDYPTFGPIRV